YAFDLLYKMYKESGYLSKDIPSIILENNLYGLDIDERATQMASFALMMKARENSRSILRKNIHLNIITNQESNGINRAEIIKALTINKEEEKEIDILLERFNEAKNFGTTLVLPDKNYKKYLYR